MMPTTMKESCWDHMETSMLTPSQLTRMSNVLVIGSTCGVTNNQITVSFVLTIQAELAPCRPCQTRC